MIERQQNYSEFEAAYGSLRTAHREAPARDKWQEGEPNKRTFCHKKDKRQQNVERKAAYDQLTKRYQRATANLRSKLNKDEPDKKVSCQEHEKNKLHNYSKCEETAYDQLIERYLRATADPLPISGGEWQGDIDVGMLYSDFARKRNAQAVAIRPKETDEEIPFPSHATSRKRPRIDDEDDDSYESNPDEQINEAIESDEGEDLQEGNFIVDITFLHAICLYSLQHQNANDQ